MSKAIPQVQKFMTTTPMTVEPTRSLPDVHKLMHEKHVRHLPVCEGTHLVGVLTEGDVLRAMTLVGGEPSKLKVSDVMASKPYAVSPGSPVNEVVEEMARRKLSSAVVQDHDHVVGIFTEIDALQAFAELLKTRLHV